MKKNPESHAEWQEAVDLAAGWRAIADCRTYGLLSGGPKIDLARCDAILDDGGRLGIFPTKSADLLAIDCIRSLNRGKKV